MTRLTGNQTPLTMTVEVAADHGRLAGDLSVPAAPLGLVIFAHGSGSGRHSPRNQSVARSLQQRGLATLLADLLSLQEEAADRYRGHLRFDIDLLGRRVIALIDWARRHDTLGALPLGVFGASTGAAAALVAAAARPNDIAAVVSRGGRPDLAGPALLRVTSPTLLLVGSLDSEVIELNRRAMSQLRCPVSLSIVAGASHLFEEPGTLEAVAARAGDWFLTHLALPAHTGSSSPNGERHDPPLPPGAGTIPQPR